MKINFLLLTIITAAITSCSSSYKTGQTPDDVYYSPARLQTDNVRRDDNKNVQDNSVYTTPEDRYIRRRIHNRRYRVYDDGYNYPYGYNNGYNNGYNSGYPVYTNSKTNTPQNTSQPRKTNLGAYTPNSTTPDSLKVFNPKLGTQNNSGTTNPVRTFGTPNNSSTNNGSGVGNLIRRIFSGDNNSNNNYNNNNYNNGNSNNSSSSRSFDRSSNNNNSNNNNSTNNSETKSAPTTNSTSVPVRTFKKDN
ncbi:MAG TPA: hypothetical protein VIM07_15995 [Chitinophagaceae bacterium]